ncbi:MAG: hypothetical protein M4579_007461 [Chaenotheca gracillima]|nr:MAG: hypothetical protein M4579_007461 [Chaenotheca gracillima]
MPKEKERPSKGLEGPAGAARQRSLSKSKPKEASRTTAETASVRRGSVVKSSRRASSAAGQTSRATAQATAPTPGPVRGAASKTDTSSSSARGAVPGASSSRGPDPNTTSVRDASLRASSSRGPDPNTTSVRDASLRASSSRGPDPKTTSVRGASLRASSSRGLDPNTTSARGAGPAASSSRGLDPSTSSARGATPTASSSRGLDPNTTSVRGATPGASSSRRPDPGSSSARSAPPGASSSQDPNPRPDRRLTQIDPVLAKFDPHQLQAEGYLEDRNVVYPPILETPIHPIFYRHRFINASDTDWDLIQPALKLATKMITNPVAMTFWHALLCGSTMRLPDHPAPHPPPSFLISRLPASETNPTRAKGDKARHLTREEAVATMDALGLYRNLIQWSFGDLTALRAYGITNRAMRAAHPLGGNGSNVQLNHLFLDALDTTGLHVFRVPSGAILPRTEFGPRTPSQLLRISFKLANTICHELAHAVWKGRCPFVSNLVGGPQSHPLQPPPILQGEFEPYFEDDRLSELGHAWEQTIFGGRVCPFLNDLSCRWGFWFERWPEGANSLYAANPRLGSFSRGPPDRENSTYWLIPMTYVRALFSNKFWDEDLPRHGSNGLKIPRTLGVRAGVQVRYSQ